MQSFGAFEGIGRNKARQGNQKMKQYNQKKRRISPWQKGPTQQIKTAKAGPPSSGRNPLDRSSFAEGVAGIRARSERTDKDWLGYVLCGFFAVPRREFTQSLREFLRRFRERVSIQCVLTNAERPRLSRLNLLCRVLLPRCNLLLGDCAQILKVGGQLR